MTINNKIKSTLGILMIFLLIICTNLIDRNNFSRVRDSVSTIYKDRIVANDLIFEISNAIHKKEIALALSDSIFYKTRNLKVNKDIDGFLARYTQTQLTSKERKVFNNFKDNIEILKKEEILYVSAKFANARPLIYKISLITDNLYDLSKIQLSEGERQMGISQKAMDKIDLFTQIEIYFLIFLAIIVQIIVMSSPKKTKEDS